MPNGSAAHVEIARAQAHANAARRAAGELLDLLEVATRAAATGHVPTLTAALDKAAQLAHEAAHARDAVHAARATFSAAEDVPG